MTPQFYGENESSAFDDSSIMDFAAGHVTGLRLMRATKVTSPLTLQERWVLRSMYCGFVWKPDVNTAGCLHSTEVSLGRLYCHTRECRETHDHSYDTPEMIPMDCLYLHDKKRIDPGHSCGFYAYTETTSNPYLGAVDKSVEAVIQGWGRTIIGTKGFRCEKARILGIVLPPHAGHSHRVDTSSAVIASELQKTYPKIPVFSTRLELLRAYPLTSGIGPGKTEGEQ